MQTEATAIEPAADGASGVKAVAPTWLWTPRVELWASMVAGALLGAAVAGEHLGGWSAAVVLAWASLAIGMVYGVRAAIIALADRRVDIDVLMVLGAGLAAGIGHPEEGALLLFLFVLAGALEKLAMQRTRREIEALHALMPTEALLWRDGAWQASRPEALVAGDRVRVRPGDRVPADATILEGSSAVDESLLTGESVPRAVGMGDGVFAGTINGEGVLVAEVERPVAESSLRRILDLVTVAREQREPLQRAIDRIGQPYTLGVITTSLAVFAVWWLGFGDAPSRAAYVAITLLIVASPCALVISTPTATLAAIARGARAGVLFKGGESIDRLSRTGAVCFDKTGTLTRGRPTVTDVVTLDGLDRRSALGAASALEADSTHPTAAAIVAAAQAEGIVPPRVDEPRAVIGRGMTGRLDGHDARVGSLAHMEGLLSERDTDRVRSILDEARTAGMLGVVVAVGGRAAVILLRDEVRPGAKGLVDRLHAMGIRPVRMLTGDDRIVAERVAKELGIDRWDASLLPEDKVAAVRETKAEMQGARGERAVAVIGDGVNDAPALAAADVSIAIGSIGSDAAMESADIVLLGEDLERVPWAIRLARRTRATVKTNISFALSVIVVMGLVTLIGSRTGAQVPLSVGVLAHEGGTLLVVLNSLRLLWFR
ncbi:MAG: cation-translocating P-type ATPase [Phycisphaerales bacterium]|nr:cation-translocating P-type ATPase [Phycisphaerales bacterium]